MMKHAEFVPLHIHTEYSLLDGAIRIEELVEEAVKFKLPALAITDHGNLFGSIKFYTKAQKAGLKPIIGAELYLAPGSRLSKEVLPTGEKAFHIILLAKNLEGYQNLMLLSSKGYLEGFYYKPRIDHELLAEHSKGLVALSACMHGEIPYYLAQGQITEAREAALRYRDIFGRDSFFIELQDNGVPEQEELNRQLYALAKELDIPVVATNDCHYLRPTDVEAHDILLCIQTNKKLNDPDRLRFNTNQLYFKSPEEMARAFQEIPQALKNTVMVAEMCNLDLRLGQYMLPAFKLPRNTTAEETLEKLALEGLRRKVSDPPPENYLKRLHYELDVIKKMGFASYFLIVWDFIDYAKRKRIPVGPGRGSAAGSLVAYCLGITEIDPIRYNLLFERFLNPDRISMPDIDIDFCKERRDEVLEYVRQKYGHDHVANIITFGTMKARQAIKDVGRVLDVPYSTTDKLAKMLPDGLDVTIKQALETDPGLLEEYNNKEEIRRTIDNALRLEGICRHASVHAAGVVISPEPLTRFTALYKNPAEQTVTTQLDMKDLETIGLLKFDFLGLKTLTVIDETLRYLQKQGIDLDINRIPLDDQKTYELLSSGLTTGVFQLESEGMKELLVKMQPKRFEDLIAVVALYRPGPLESGMVDDYIARKKGLKSITYDIPDLAEILDETYGVIIYQEQVMQIAHRLGGFTLAEADQLRKAMGKKIEEEMARLGEKFVKGAVQRGYPEDKVRRLYEQMKGFGRYGFNKSHSAAYAYVSYQTAYLKAHYPVEFMAANLSKEDKPDKMVLLLKECRNMGIKVLPPDINLSEEGFSVQEGSIRFGLGAIKGMGDAAAGEIIGARQQGPFKDLEDFLARIDTRKINKRVLEALVKSGALDRLAPEEMPLTQKRAWLFDRLTGSKKTSSGPSLFEQAPEPQSLQSPLQWSEMEMLTYEKETLGFYVSGHPIDQYEKALTVAGVLKTSQLERIPEGQTVLVAGIISSLKKKLTRHKEKMAMFSLDDDEGSVECIAFPAIVAERSELLEKNKMVVIEAGVEKTEKATKLLVKDILTLEDLWKKPFRVEINLGADQLNSQSLSALKAIASKHRGQSALYIRLRDNGRESLIQTDQRLLPVPEVIEEIEKLINPQQIRLYHQRSELVS